MNILNKIQDRVKRNKLIEKIFEDELLKLYTHQYESPANTKLKNQELNPVLAYWELVELFVCETEPHYELTPSNFSEFLKMALANQIFFDSYLDQYYLGTKYQSDLNDREIINDLMFYEAYLNRYKQTKVIQSIIFKSDLSSKSEKSEALKKINDSIAGYKKSEGFW